MLEQLATSLPISLEARTYIVERVGANEQALGRIRTDCIAGVGVIPNRAEVCPAVLAETLKYAGKPQSIPVTDARHPYFTALAAFRNTKGAESIRQLPPEVQFEFYVRKVTEAGKNNPSMDGTLNFSMATPAGNYIDLKVPREALFEAGYMSKVNELACGNHPQYGVIVTDRRIKTIAQDNFKDDPFASSKTYATTLEQDWDGGYALADNDINKEKAAIPRRQCYRNGPTH